MNILQMIWSALTVPNELLIKFIAIPLTFLDIFVCMLYFSSILNITTTKKRKILYVLIYGIVANIITFVVPISYSIYVNLIVWPIMVFFILKTTVLKSILSEIITMVTSAILEFILANILLLFSITSDMIVSVPIYRLIVVLSVYLIIYLLSKLIRAFKINIKK